MSETTRGGGVWYSCLVEERNSHESPSRLLHVAGLLRVDDL